MNLGGWIFMTVSVGFVWILTILCFVEVLRSPSEDDGNG
jgi:hypothetical protein